MLGLCGPRGPGTQVSNQQWHPPNRLEYCKLLFNLVCNFAFVNLVYYMTHQQGWPHGLSPAKPGPVSIYNAVRNNSIMRPNVFRNKSIGLWMTGMLRNWFSSHLYLCFEISRAGRPTITLLARYKQTNGFWVLGFIFGFCLVLLSINLPNLSLL